MLAYRIDERQKRRYVSFEEVSHGDQGPFERKRPWSVVVCASIRELVTAANGWIVTSELCHAVRTATNKYLSTHPRPVCYPKQLDLKILKPFTETTLDLASQSCSEPNPKTNFVPPSLNYKQNASVHRLFVPSQPPRRHQRRVLVWPRQQQRHYACSCDQGRVLGWSRTPWRWR